MPKFRKSVFKVARVIGRLFYRKHVWLVSDREMSAGDNGEAFFKFLQDKNVNSVFAISTRSKDYARISKIGKVVEYGSSLYKFLLCVSDCHCSSQLIHMENHEETPQIFLQHGVATNNLSKMLNPASHKNFYIVTSANIESNIMKGEDHIINPEHVWLTGIPRFDYLKNNTSKKIVIAFTWRHYLAGVSEGEFKNSAYYKTICRIMNDRELGRYLKEKGYELYIKLHPEMDRFKNLFSDTTVCSLYKETYNKLYEEAALMITDYSSAIYDFLYLGKPVLYYHFDGNMYYDNNPFVNQGEFDYIKNGFGPVVNEYEEFVKAIKSAVDNNCLMTEEYRERCDCLFAYNDFESCERIYNKIKEVI